MGHYTYLLINIFTILFPLALSFDKKVNFFSNIRHVIFGTGLGGLIFIPWDMAFTAMNIWSFNPNYNLGIYLGNMPLEEYLFFLTVPYACLFIYECLRGYIKRDFLRGIHFIITPFAILILTLLVINNFEKTYTAVASAFLILLLFIQLIKLRQYMSWFYISYLVCLIPFFIVNGILTSMPVIVYNDAANLGLRLGTIPVDDFIYNAGLLLIVTIGYEWSKRKFKPKPAEIKEPTAAEISLNQ
jgi:lycopene cyclase domain-containing protein